MILGIDLSARKVAAVGLRGDDAIVFSEEAPRKMTDRAQVCLHFWVWAKKLFADAVADMTPAPVYVWVEEPIVAKVAGPKVTIGQAQVDGVVQAAALHSVVTGVYSVHHSRWKRDVVGSGNANKSMVGEWLEHHQPRLAALAGGNQDLIDAACVALYGHGVLARADRLAGGVPVDDGGS